MTNNIIDALFTIEYNWADWINERQTSKGVASAHCVMAILEAKDQIAAIMNYMKYRPITYGLEEIGLDTLNKVTDVLMSHQMAVVSEKDKIESELRST